MDIIKKAKFQNIWNTHTKYTYMWCPKTSLPLMSPRDTFLGSFVGSGLTLVYGSPPCSPHRWSCHSHGPHCSLNPGWQVRAEGWTKMQRALGTADTFLFSCWRMQQPWPWACCMLSSVADPKTHSPDSAVMPPFLRWAHAGLPHTVTETKPDPAPTCAALGPSQLLHSQSVSESLNTPSGLLCLCPSPPLQGLLSHRLRRFCPCSTPAHNTACLHSHPATTVVTATTDSYIPNIISNFSARRHLGLTLQPPPA